MEYSRKCYQINSDGVLIAPPNNQLYDPPKEPLRYQDFTESDILAVCDTFCQLGIDMLLFNFSDCGYGDV